MNNITQVREESNIKLRKDKLQESIKQKRFSNFTSNSSINEKFAIKVEELTLDLKFIETFNQHDDKLNIAFDLLKENDQNFLFFGVRQIRNFTETIDKKMNLEQLIRPDQFNAVLELLLSSDELKIIFETSWIIINITNFSDFYVKLMAKSSNVKMIFNILNKSPDPIIQNHVVWILSNMLGENEDIYNLVVNNCDLARRIIEWIIADCATPNYLKQSCLWTVGNLFKYSANDKHVHLVVPALPIICKYLKSTINYDLFSEALYATKRILISADNYDEVYETIMDCKLAVDLITQIQLNLLNLWDLESVVSILGSLIWKDSKYLKELYQADFLDKIETLFAESLLNIQTENIPLKRKNYYFDLYKTITWCLNNIAISDDDITDKIIRHSKIPKHVLEIFNLTSNKNLREEILSFFNSAAESSISKVKTELLRIQILELFCDNLKDSSIEIQTICLQGIYKFLSYGTEIMKERNIIKEEIERLGIASQVDALQLSSNDEVSKSSNKIINEFFNSE